MLKELIKLTEDNILDDRIYNLYSMINRNDINMTLKIYSNASKIKDINKDKLYNAFINYVTFLHKNDYSFEQGNHVSVIQILCNLDLIKIALDYVNNHSIDKKDNSIYSPFLSYYTKIKDKDDSILIFENMPNPTEIDYYNIMKLFKDELKFYDLFTRYKNKYKIVGNHDIINLLDAKKTIINNDGICINCNTKLVKFQYEHLNLILQNLDNIVINIKTDKNGKELQNKDIMYLLSIWSKFKNIKFNFDYVIDGANIGYLGIPQKLINTILTSNITKVINQLENKKVLLILHTRHKEAITFFKNNNNIKLFIVPKNHNDDWYALYAALASNCYLISNDKIRDHVNNLHINDWKTDYIINVDKNTMALINPLPYTKCIQMNNSIIHLPAIDGNWYHNV